MKVYGINSLVHPLEESRVDHDPFAFAKGNVAIRIVGSSSPLRGDEENDCKALLLSVPQVLIPILRGRAEHSIPSRVTQPEKRPTICVNKVTSIRRKTAILDRWQQLTEDHQGSAVTELLRSWEGMASAPCPQALMRRTDMKQALEADYFAVSNR
jgi:hypothetical protein